MTNNFIKKRSHTESVLSVCWEWLIPKQPKWRKKMLFDSLSQYIYGENLPHTSWYYSAVFDGKKDDLNKIFAEKKLFILVVPVLQNQRASSQHCRIIWTFNDHSETFFIERTQIAISPQAVASVDQDALHQLQLQCQLLLYLLSPIVLWRISWRTNYHVALFFWQILDWPRLAIQHNFCLSCESNPTIQN